MKTTKLLAAVGSSVAIMAGAMMMTATPAISDGHGSIEVITHAGAGGGTTRDAVTDAGAGAGSSRLYRVRGSSAESKISTGSRSCGSTPSSRASVTASVIAAPMPDSRPPQPQPR